MLPDEDGALRLLAAVVKLWLRDARQDSEEQAAIAAWLDVTPAELQRRIEGDNRPARASPFYRLCPGCGRALPEHSSRECGTGRRRLYCDDKCRHRAARLKERNHDAV